MAIKLPDVMKVYENVQKKIMALLNTTGLRVGADIIMLKENIIHVEIEFAMLNSVLQLV